MKGWLNKKQVSADDFFSNAPKTGEAERKSKFFNKAKKSPMRRIEPKKTPEAEAAKKAKASMLFGAPPPKKEEPMEVDEPSKKRFGTRAKNSPFGKKPSPEKSKGSSPATKSASLFGKPSKKKNPAALFGAPKEKVKSFSSMFKQPPKSKKRRRSSPDKQSKSSTSSPAKRKKRKKVEPEGTPEPPKPPSKYPDCEPWCLCNKNVVVQGEFPGWSKEELRNLVVRNGGRPREEVSCMTHYLVWAPGGGDDRKKAKCPIYTLEDFLKFLPTLPEQAAPKIRTKKGPKQLELWVEKYKPKKTSDLVGNKAQVQKLQNYLRNWPKIKNKTGKGVKRACLLSGPPGLGKTSAATIVARDMGFEVLEFNASDARGKKALKQQVEAATQYRSMSEFAKLGAGKAAKERRPICIVMDEVDGMSGGDRGGNAQLCVMIRTTQIPMLCICNDRSKDSIRTLANYCEDLKFRRPNPDHIAKRMACIAQAEGLNISPDVLVRLASGVNSDLRQCVNLLQLWSNSPDDKRLTASSLDEKLKTGRKDVTLGPWDVIPQFFSMHRNVPEKERMYKGVNWYFVDSQIVPLFIFENYLAGSWGETEIKTLTAFADAAESMSDGDLADAVVRETQNYSLTPMFGTLFCTKPCLITGPARGSWVQNRPNFPMWLGKNGSRRKNTRLVSELNNHMSNHITGSNTAILQDYFPLLRLKMSDPILKKGVDGLDEVIAVMKQYSMCREDWDSICNDVGVDLSKVLPNEYSEINITKQVKVQFNKKARDSLKVYADSKGPAPPLRKTVKGEGGDSGDEKEPKKKAVNKLFKQKKVPKKKKGKGKGAKKGTKRKATKRKKKG